MKHSKKRKQDKGWRECEMAKTMGKSDIELIEGMEKYLQHLKNLPKDEAQKEAKKALIRTGVLTKEGKPKKSIVSWE